MRLSWARQLSIEAAATESEWVASLPRRIAPLEILDGNAYLRHALAYAHYVSTDPLAVRVGSILHVINPPETVREELNALANVELHDIEPRRRTVLRRMLRAANRLTADDLLDDPFLDGLIEQHAKDDIDRDVLSFARAALVLSDFTGARSPAPVQDFRGAITSLLAGTRMEAALRLDVSADMTEKDRWAIFAAPESYAAGAGGPDRFVPVSLPPLASMTVRRGEEVVGVCLKRPRVDSNDAEATFRIAELGEDPDAWTDEVLDALRFRSRPVPSMTPPRFAAISFASEHWANADREAAFALAALRAAVPKADVIALPSGAIMLTLGSGVFAEIDVREHLAAADDEPEVSLTQQIVVQAYAQQRWDTEPLTTLLPMFTAQTSGYGRATTDFGPRLPHAVHLRGRGLCADIVFRASPLFASLPLTTALAFAASAGAEMLDDARRHDDD